MPLRLEGRGRQLLPDRDRRQAPLLVVLGRLVAAGCVRQHEAGERDHRAARPEGRVGVVGRGSAELDGDGLAGRVLHLRGDRPLEDQVVERQFVATQPTRELGRRAEHVACRADRLVRLLCVRDGALVPAGLGWHGVRAVFPGRVRARGLQRGVGERHRVGAHVRDVAVLVQPLREAHRRLGREPQLAARLLLERRRPERRGRTARVRLLVDLPHVEEPSLEPRHERLGSLLVEHEDVAARGAVLAEVATLRDACPIDGHEARLERAGLERPDDVPVARGDESHPFPLALDDEPGGHRLHTPRREPRHDLLPQHGRDLEPVEAVEDSAGLLSVDEALVDLARLVERALDRVPRDLVEDHPSDRHLWLQHLAQVPGDRLALAVLVRREQELVRVAELLPQVRDHTLLVGVDNVERLELVLDVHAELAVTLALLLRDVRGPVREVADVPDARLDDEVAAEVAGDRPRFGGRLDDDEAGCHIGWTG